MRPEVQIQISNLPLPLFRYECTVHNQLGTEIQFSNLAISTSNSTIGGILTDGREDNSLSQTIEVIIAAFVCILFLIILVLLYLCCRTRMRRRASGTRRNSSRADSDFEQGNLRFKRSSSSNPLRDGNLPPSMNTSGSPGEGEFDIHEHVRKVLLSPSREDLSDSIVSPTNRNPRTGLLTTDLKNSRKSPPPPPLPIRGDSSHPLKEEEVEERDSGTGASKKSSEDPEDEYQDRETLLRSISMQQGGGEGAISLSEFEIGNSYCGKESKGVIPFADQEEDSLEDGPNSIVSDSSTQQGGGEGQFGSMDGGETEDFDESTTASSSMFTDQEGRPANRSHHQPHDVVVSNHAMDDSNSSFKTFHPKGRRQRQISEVQALRSAKSSYNVFGGINNPNQGSDILDGGGTKNQLKTSTKRASAVELNGKCYLPIEPEPDPTEVPLEARVYRGGVGSLPRRGLDLQLELLEASLNSSDCLDDSRLSQRPMLKKNRNSFSRNSLLGGSKRQKQGKSHNRREPSLPRIKIKDPNKNNDLERSNVALKSKDMFT